MDYCPCGMLLINTHLDYMNFADGKIRIEEYSSRNYENILAYIKKNYEGEYWHVLPKDLAAFWKTK